MPNVLLVGSVGVGKSQIIENLLGGLHRRRIPDRCIPHDPSRNEIWHDIQGNGWIDSKSIPDMSWKYQNRELYQHIKHDIGKLNFVPSIVYRQWFEGILEFLHDLQQKVHTIVLVVNWHPFQKFEINGINRLLERLDEQTIREHVIVALTHMEYMSDENRCRVKAHLLEHLPIFKHSTICFLGHRFEGPDEHCMQWLEEFRQLALQQESAIDFAEK